MGHATSMDSRTLESRLETVGDGLVLLLIAALAAPGGILGRVAVMTVGMLLLALNVARYARGIEVRLLSTTIGAWATIAGAGALAGLALDPLALLFLVLGLVVLGTAAVGTD
jgi:hypothetical protein